MKLCFHNFKSFLKYYRTENAISCFLSYILTTKLCNEGWVFIPCLNYKLPDGFGRNWPKLPFHRLFRACFCWVKGFDWNFVGCVTCLFLGLLCIPSWPPFRIIIQFNYLVTPRVLIAQCIEAQAFKFSSWILKLFCIVRRYLPCLWQMGPTHDF